MYVKFNPTGTHIRNGWLKVRFDLYPDVASQTYASQYVPHFDREPTKEELADRSKLALIPTHLELNPCLCHFITVPEFFTPEDLENYAYGVFDKDILATLDNLLVLPDSAHMISPLMRNRGRFASKAISARDPADLISTINDRFKSLVVLLEGNGKAQFIEPESIDIGASPIDRPSQGDISDYTVICTINPANATGILDTVQVWSYSGLSNFRVGTATISGSTGTCRDSTGNLGNIPYGSLQTITGQSFNVVTGDYIIFYATGGTVEMGAGAGGDSYYAEGEHIDPSDSATCVTYNQVWSVYATGTEGGATAKTSAETGAGAEGSALRAAMQRAESAGGADTRQSLLASLTRNENGTGVEQSLLSSLVARLAAETGSGIETRSLVARLVSSDVGHGVDTGVIPGLKSIFGNDGGIGYDALKALIGTSGAVSDMKLPGRQGQVKIPSKGVSL